MSKLLIRDRLRRRRSIQLDQDQGQQVDGGLSDRELMELVTQDDQEAFDYLYLRYKEKLQRFINGFVRDEVTTEDLLQETFLRVYQNADKYDPSHRFAAWLYRIATNLCLNELRRRRMHPRISLNQQVQVGLTDSENETVELHEMIPDSYFIGPDEAVESSETLHEISAAMEALTNVQRQTLSMHLYDEMKYEQIADVMSCSVGTVKSRMFYGLRALRNKLESDSSKEPENEDR